MFRCDIDEDNEEFETALLERYKAARPREDELLRELDGRGDEERLGALIPRISCILSSSGRAIEGPECCGGGLA